MNARASAAKGTSNPRSSSPRTAGNNERDMNAVRAWLRESGHQLSDRGRVAQRLLHAYDAAH